MTNENLPFEILNVLNEFELYGIESDTLPDKPDNLNFTYRVINHTDESDSEFTQTLYDGVTEYHDELLKQFDIVRETIKKYFDTHVSFSFNPIKSE